METKYDKSMPYVKYSVSRQPTYFKKRELVESKSSDEGL
jgi:hypothetical protein